MKIESYPPRPTHLLHLLLKEKISPGDTVIDATAGNGHDTLFLADAVGETGIVIAIDIQQQAIDSARTRLEAASLAGRANFHRASHTQIREIASGITPTAILFNLGYLPGGDHSIITRTADSVSAIAASIEILAQGGILAVICYPGHSGGDEEASSVSSFISSQSELLTARYGLIGTHDPAPFLLLSQKRF